MASAGRAVARTLTVVLSVPELLSLVLLPIALGTGILRVCGLRYASDRLAYLGWSWVTGATGTGLLLFGWLWIGVPLTPVLPLQTVILALAVMLYVTGTRVRAVVPAPAHHAFSTPERVLFAAVTSLSLAVTAVRVLVGSLRPLLEGDDAQFWALKAKVIYLSGGFTDAFARVMADPSLVAHKDYPLLNPLLQVWTFAHAGEITHVANRLPIQLFAVALVLILAAALRRAARPAVAAALLLCIVSLPVTVHQTVTAYADLMVGLGVLMAFDTWSRWQSSTSAAAGLPWWRLFCLALAFMLWSKNEGLLYLGAMLAAALICQVTGTRRDNNAAEPAHCEPWLLLLPAAIIVLTWGLNGWYGFANDLLTGDTRDMAFPGLLRAQFASRAPAILSYLGRNVVLNNVVLNAVRTNLLILAFMALVAGAPRRIWHGALRLPTLAVVFTFGGYVIVFAGAPHNLTWHLSTAAARVTYQVVPAIALWLALAGTRLFPRFGPGGKDPSAESASISAETAL